MMTSVELFPLGITATRPVCTCWMRSDTLVVLHTTDRQIATKRCRSCAEDFAALHNHPDPRLRTVA